MEGLTHGDEFLGGRGMDGDGLVKLSLGGAHLDGDWEALEHLIAAQPLHVQADHLREKKYMKKQL